MSDLAPHQGGLLTLDLSTKTGFAYGHIGDPKPTGGVWLLGTSSNGLPRPWTALLDRLGDTLRMFEPSLVVFEAPLPAMRQKQEKIARLLIGLAVLVETTCWRWDIECLEQDAGTARRDILGKARPEKKEIVSWCQGKGWDVADDNHADALLLWQWVGNKRTKSIKVSTK